MHVSLHTPDPAPTTLAGYVKAGSLTPTPTARSCSAYRRTRIAAG